MSSASVRRGPATVQEWAEHWNARAAITDAAELNGYCIGGVPIGADEYRAALIEPWVGRLELEPCHHVLEVGCGSGELLSEIERRVERAVGTDISTALLARYRGAAQTYVCAAHELPFEAPEFDRIVMASVSHYFPSPEYFRGVVTDLVSLLRPGGLLLVADLLLGAQPATTPHLWYEPASIIDLCDELGVDFALLSQPARKRAINRRFDLIVRTR